jgi:hypothetical protein
MNLIFFFVVLTLCGVGFAKVEPLIVMPVVAPLAMFKNTKNPFVYVFGVVGWLWQIYVVLAWCVVAVLFTQMFMSRPSVEHRWIYYAIGFFGCLAPIQFMLSFDREPDVTRTIIQFASVLLTALGFIAFVFYPGLAYPWFWIVRLWAR